MSRQSTSAKTKILAVAYVIYFTIGLYGSSTSAMVPELAQRNFTSVATMGLIFTAGFLGALPAQMATGWLTERFGYRPVVVAALVALSGGSVGVILSHSFPLTLAGFACRGLGYGFLSVSLNVVLSQFYAGRSSGILNLANFFAGVGSVIGPSFAGLLLINWGSSLPVFGLVAAVFLLMVPFIATLDMGVFVSRGAMQSQTFEPIYGSPALWLLGILLLLYVGTEAAVGGWTPVYMQHSAGYSIEAGAFVGSAFWLALTAGRLAGVLLSARLSARRLVSFSLAGALVSSVLTLLSVGNPPVTIASLVLLGLSLGPVYPTVLAIVMAYFQGSAARAASVTVAMASIGGMTLPWIVGALLAGSGAQVAAAFNAAVVLLMLLIYAGFGLRARRTAP